MKTTQNTQTYKISLTEIALDCDDPTRLELSFRLDASPAYIRSTEYFADATEHDPAGLTDFYDAIDEYDELDTDYFSYDFNVASRHDSNLYAIISGDHSGDCFDDLDHAVFQFGQPAIDFIADACRLLNVPFYPNAD